MPGRHQRTRLFASLLLAVGLTLGSAEASSASGVVVTDLTNGKTAAQLAGALAGAGVSISNVTYTGDNRAAGAYTNGASTIGFDGIVLSSGYVQTHTGEETTCSRGVEGPNDCNESGGANGGENSTSLGTPGDSDLDALLPSGSGATEDATILQFDFIPEQSTLHFSYVFSSEEYNDYVGGGFNDVFGFFVNGANCALVPGTSDPVGVDTINNGDIGGGFPPHHPEFYRDNVRPSPSIDSQMDGLTTILGCTAHVNAGQTNHVKLAIADTNDSAFDSAVFIAAGSFVSSNSTLTVNKSGNGSGSVGSSPGGVDCGGTCSAQFGTGTPVTLTATPAAGSTFAGWSGGGCSGTGTCTVQLNSDTTVTATFTLIKETLTVTKAGTGSGSVSSSPAGISCGATCSAQFDYGTMVTLTPTADSGSAFTGWTGACSGIGACVVTMDQARAVTATFDAVPTQSVPPSVPVSGLFCGVQHRGKCNGIKIKTVFTGPGNAVWQFAAYNPSPGHARANGAASKIVVLGSIKRTITKAGTVTIVFKLKAGAKTKKLYKKVVKNKLKSIRVTLTFTTPSGQRITTTTRIKLKR
jgi:hypothetical protein